LLELTIVVMLVGILAAVAVYTYKGVVARARMTQAKTVLAHLARTQAIHIANHERYTDNVALLDFDPVRYPFYRVEVTLDNGGRSFIGYARGVGPMAGDLWYITPDGVPTQDNSSAFRF
jgi:type II secretory pathway pseudopilin PulG